jgi:hypothetical protein
MRSQCIKAVSQALGRQLTKAEADAITGKITASLRNLARRDPAGFGGKSTAQRLQEAAIEAGKSVLAEAKLKQTRVALQVQAHQRIQSFIAERVAEGMSPLQALDRLIAFDADMRSKTVSIESWAEGVNADLVSRMLDALDVAKARWFGLADNPKGARDLIMEIRGQDSGNPQAKAGAKVWKEVTESARLRFNRAGGDIGKLDDWGMPQHHSQARVAKAGRDKWVADTAPLLDRGNYFNPDGTRMSDVQLNDFLRNAYDTIATGGANKLAPGQFRGAGARANRGSTSRQIHFRDADSYLKYQESYGDRSLPEIILGHVEGISKDIALVEAFGPNPDSTYRYFRDQAAKDSVTADPTKLGGIESQKVKVDNLYNVVTGKTLPVANERIANGFDTVRNWLVASRLGSAVITSLSDEATMRLVAQTNNLPQLRLIKNQLATLNVANRVEERMANRAGLGLRAMLGTLNRFGTDSLVRSKSRKLANFVIRAQGLTAITEARRRAFSVTMMDAIGSVVRDHGKLSDLDPVDNATLLSKGVTEADYAVWKAAKAEDWGSGNKNMLTTESIYRTSDADIDPVIAPRVKELKDSAQAEIADLSARDAQDQTWIGKRSSDLTAWLNKSMSIVAARTAKADAAAKPRFEALSEKMNEMREAIDGARGMWDTPRDANTPGIDPAQTVGFYGKGTLRGLGVTEGKALQSLTRLNERARELKRELDGFKKDELDALGQKFDERRVELTEFIDRANERSKRRQQVADRINRDIAPKIEAERMRARETAATKLLGIILEESDMAVIQPGARERTLMHANIQSGTFKGELARSFFQFKAFPIAMITRHVRRGLAGKAANPAVYLAALVASTTVLGVISMQVNEVLSGRDPRNLNPAEKGGVRGWFAGMLKGGSLGLYGDFLFGEASRYGQTPIAAALGPTVGLAESVLQLTQQNAMEALGGKDTSFGAEATRFVRSNTPGANLWYAKAALDHLIFHQLQEFFSPGYLAKMRARSRREYNQDFYWQPGEVLPDRAPDLGALVGD